MRKFLIFFSLLFGLTASAYAAETLALADGSSVSGDIVKFDDHDAMIHTTADSYTNITWPQFSQDALKQLAANPKLRQFVTPFIEPAAAGHSSQPQKSIHPVENRMTLPQNPSILGGLVHSSLGLFILLVVYGANLYAAFEVAVVRGKAIGAVMGLSAILPVIGPIIFLAQPIKKQATEEPLPEETAPAAAPLKGGAQAPTQAPGQDDIQIVSASWNAAQEEKKPQPQVFSRGKFTLNKRFIETKFAGFIGEPKGEAKNFTMEIKTLKETLAVECFKQLAVTEAIVETPTGQVTLPFADIQEIKLIPKPA